MIDYSKYKFNKTTNPYDKCPSCGSNNVVGEDSMTSEWEYTCEDCGLAWIEYYKFTHWEPIE